VGVFTARRRKGGEEVEAFVIRISNTFYGFPDGKPAPDYTKKKKKDNFSKLLNSI
jgi:hypothetical protein